MLPARYDDDDDDDGNRSNRKKTLYSNQLNLP